MMNDINIVFIHGVSSQITGYSNYLFQKIVFYFKLLLKKRGLSEKESEEKCAQFIQREILWADATTDITNRYIKLEYELFNKKGGLWNWVMKRIDPLALQIMYYIKDKGDKPTGEMSILNDVHRHFQYILRDSKHVVVVAHSLGSVIAFDYLFGFRKYALAREFCVHAFITMGSPLPLFISAMGHVGSDLVLPEYIKAWYNIINNNDAVARRCQPFFQHISLKDIEVNTGIFPLRAHTRYWGSEGTARAIAGILTEIGQG